MSSYRSFVDFNFMQIGSAVGGTTSAFYGFNCGTYFFNFVYAFVFEYIVCVLAQCGSTALMGISCLENAKIGMYDAQNYLLCTIL